MTSAPRRVGLVWAQAANGVIGRDGTVPWRLAEDLRRFRELTAGSTVLMGRRTWESLPDRFRPLPGRRNLVLTRDHGWSAPGAVAVPDLGAGLAAADPAETVWVIGGAAAYDAALPLAAVLEVTELAEAVDGDVRAPVIPAGWTVTLRDPADGWHTSTTGLRYRYRRWERRAAPPRPPHPPTTGRSVPWSS